MEDPQAPTPPPIAPQPGQVYQTNPAPVKQPMGRGAKVGIGCGAIFLLFIIGGVVLAVMFAGRLKNFAEEAQQNPTRATVTTMVKFSGGTLQIVAEDDVLKRYTLKDSTGKLITVYWDEAAQAPVTISGDFSAIPTTPVIPSPDQPEVTPTPSAEPVR